MSKHQPNWVNECVCLCSSEVLLVLSELDCPDVALEVEFSNALHLRVIPQHDFVSGELGTLSSAHECYDVSPVKHLHNANASIKFYRIRTDYKLIIM